MQRNREKYAGIAFFALGIACFALAGLLVYLFSGRFANTPSGMKAGPAPSLSRRAEVVVEDPLPAPVKRDERKSEARPPRARPEEDVWVLYITGEVVAPGVYSLPPESRTFQLVEAAGGFTPKADPVRINMASPLMDGMHVHVPALPALASVQQLVPEEPAASFPAYPPPPSSSSGSGGGGAINVNTASAAELQRIPGVGPVLARAIIEYREQHGRFSSVDDLQKVSGIGVKRVESMRSSVVVR